jgi:hypothetical protein
VVDRIINHLKLKFTAETLPLLHVLGQAHLMAVALSAKYF